MKRTHLICFLIIILFVINSLGNYIFSNTYYVDQNHSQASNSNPGSINLPWLTIQHAAETLVAGDTVYIRNGIYNENVFTIRGGNTSAGYIVFAAYPNEIPVIDGTGVVGGNNGFTIAHGYIKLIGIEIKDWETGIWMEYAEFIEISNCEVHECTYGIGASYGTHDFTLNNVVIHHFDLYGFDATPGGGLDCYNGTFNDCISHTGRDPAQNVDGFALGHGTQHNFVFNRCETYNVFDGFDISSESTTLNECNAHDCWNGGYKLWQRNINLINCLGYNSATSNVELDWDNEPGGSTLINCTFYNSQTFNIWVENSADTLRMYNCIIAGGDNIGLAFEMADISNYHGDHNLFHNDDPDRVITVAYTDEFSLQQIQNGSWTAYSNQDSHSLVAFNDNDIFVNPSNNNLHLLESSAAVDNGTSSSAPSIDFDGNPRPSGQEYDIGAYEYQYPNNVGENSYNFNKKKFVLFQNHPNPFNPNTTAQYHIPELSFVTLKVYDVLGNVITTLVNEEKPVGGYEIVFDATWLPSGVYFYQLQAGSFVETKKMLLMK